MNANDIEIVRIPKGGKSPSLGAGVLIGVGTFFWNKSDDQLRAEIKCRKRHDDSYTANSSEGANRLVIFESGWDLTPKDVSKPLLEPDPRCVIRKTYELQCQREFQEQESMVGVTSDTKEEIDKRYRLRIPKLAI